MKYIKQNLNKYLTYLIMLTITFSLILLFKGQNAAADEIAEAEMDPSMDSQTSNEDVSSGTKPNNLETPVGQPYKIPEAKLNLIREFPFESIAGFSWTLYSEKPLSEIYADFSPKVGAIYSAKVSSGQEANTYKVLANGFFISADGYFLTTYYQLKDIFTDRNIVNPSIELKLQTADSLKLIDLELVKSDPEGDLIIFQADLEQLELTEIPYVEFSQFSPVIGQPVFGIGFPDVLAVEGGLYPGFITEISRTKILESGCELTEIISSALIPNTASGSLIVNSGGQAIGISTSSGIRSISDRYSVFYTSNQLSARLDYLLSGVESQSTVWTGITLLSDADYLNLAQTFNLPNGCFVANVVIDSPAYVSDIRKNDIILSVNEQIINSGSEFREILKDYQPGDALAITIYRPNLDKESVHTLYLDSK